MTKVINMTFMTKAPCVVKWLHLSRQVVDDIKGQPYNSNVGHIYFASHLMELGSTLMKG
jgi:hypothetical protein